MTGMQIKRVPCSDGVERPVYDLLGGEIVGENENEALVVTEYCLPSCPDPIHDGPRDPWHWCPNHVHRSIAMTVKHWPDGLGAIAQPLG